MELQFGEFYIKLEGTIGLLIVATPLMLVMQLPMINKIIRRILATIKLRSSRKYSQDLIDKQVKST